MNQKERLKKVVIQFRAKFPEYVRVECNKQFYNAGVNTDQIIELPEKFCVIALVNGVAYELVLEEIFQQYMKSLEAGLKMGVKEARAKENAYRHIREGIGMFLTSVMKFEQDRITESHTDERGV